MSSNREGISRFFGKQEMSDVEFLYILKSLLPYIREGVLDTKTSRNIDIVEKMDSSFFQIGMNERGEFFVQTSNSPEVTSSNYEHIFKSNVTLDFKASFVSLSQNKQLQKSLRETFKKFGPFKIDCELFPVLTHKGDEQGKVRFNVVQYDKNKFGTQGALVLFKVWVKDENNSWIRPPQIIAHQILEKVSSADNLEWRIYTNKDLKIHKVIDLSSIQSLLPNYLSTENDIDDAIDLLKNKNRKFAAQLKKDIQPMRSQLQIILDDLANNHSSLLGKIGEHTPSEGVILRIKEDGGKTIEIKGTSEKFAETKESVWKIRTDIQNLEEEFIENILSSAYHIPKNIQQVQKELSSITSNVQINSQLSPEKREKEFLRIIIESLSERSLSDVDMNAIQSIFENTQRKFEDILQSLDTQDIDADTKRKSEMSLNDFQQKIDKISEILHSRKNNDEKAISIFKELLLRKLERVAGKYLNYQGTQEELINFQQYYRNLNPAIVWVGRAQPWHIGHHKMVEMAKKYMNEIGANKVLIILVKGSKSSKDVEKNPLSEQDQYEMLEALYNNDSEVEISKKPILVANIMHILNAATDNNCYIVGFLAGDDRINEYKSMFEKFNAFVWLKDHNYLPIRVKENGTSDVVFIQTPRLMSGTEARKLVSELEFSEWIKVVLPVSLNNEIIKTYRKIYNKIKNLKEDILYENIYNIFFGSHILMERMPLKQPDNNKDDNEDKIEDIKDDQVDDIKDKDDVKDEKDDIQDIQDKDDIRDDDTQIDDIKDDSDRIGEESSDIYEISDDGKNLINKETGEIVDFEVTDDGLVKVDGDILDIEVGEDGKLHPRPQGGPEQKPKIPENKKEIIDNLKLYLPKFLFVRNPKLFQQLAQSFAGFLWKTFIWMLRAEDQKGGAAVASFGEFISDKYKEINNFIKTGKASARELQQLLLQYKRAFVKKFKQYDEIKKNAENAFTGSKDEFYKIAKERRMNVYLGLKEKDTKIDHNKDYAKTLFIPSLNEFINEKAISEKYPDIINKAKKIYDTYKNNQKSLTLDKIVVEFERNGIPPSLFVLYLQNCQKNGGKFNPKDTELGFNTFNSVLKSSK